jgi:SWI/SNF-related matrix-associated actin-dependent regulator 1 of chromatin subfamily A
VAGTVVRYHWLDELTRWLPDSLSVEDVLVPTTAAAALAPAAPPTEDGWRRTYADGGGGGGGAARPRAAGSVLRRGVLGYVLSYDLATRLAPQLSALAPQVIVADESQFLKSRTAQRTLAALPLLAAARRALLLSGTPALSAPAELYTQLHALDPDTYGSFSHFAARYCDARRTRFGLDVRGSCNLAELHAVVFATVGLRRCKADVLAQLPPKTREVRVLPCAARPEDVTRLKDLVEARGSEPPERRRALLLNAFQDAGLAKLPALVEHVARLAADGGASGKHVLFGHHLAVLDGVQRRALSPDNHVRIDGSTPPAARREAVRRFQNEPRLRFFLLALSAGGTALTLTAARHVVFLELYAERRVGVASRRG